MVSYAIPAPQRVQQVLQPYRGRLLEIDGSATAYNAEGLIVSTSSGNAPRVGSELRRLLANHQCTFEGPGWLDDNGAEVQAFSYVSGIRIRPLEASAPDPWMLLSAMRGDAGSEVTRAVGLNHLLTTPERLGGNPFAIGHGRVGLDSYGQAAGGRGVVTLLGPAPQARRIDRRPRVVVLDTEIGRHWWFHANPPESEFRTRGGTLAGSSIHPYRTGTGSELPQAVDPFLGTIGSRAGHGTFIAGLIRQACPGADIIGLPVMGSDGVVPEHMLIRALDLILGQQLQNPGWADAVVLSLGYYSETIDDVKYSSGLKKVLLALARAGVAVFASAGNDRTSRPSYPAAFAADPEFADPAILPLISVAALNPDGSLAAFSNFGDWVTTSAVGVNLVSAVTDLNGAEKANLRTIDRRGRIRASTDDDNFVGGFASWSGTSFATPVVAGQYLTALIQAGFPRRNTDRRDLLPRRIVTAPTDPVGLGAKAGAIS